MKKYKALYKGMYDDLKDSEMMIDYAYCIRENEEDKTLADDFARYAQSRLQHFKEFHNLFENEVMKQNNTNSEIVYKCMWDEAHETLQDWHEKIEKKINKY